MKSSTSSINRKLILLIGSMFLNLLVLPNFLHLYAQGGNTISGYVFGLKRTPLNDLNVELLDEFSRTLQRIRTSGGGRYAFYNLSAGRFKVRVYTFGTIYMEQEQDIEIANFSTRDREGNTKTFGASNEQRDFYLLPNKQMEKVINDTIFVQEVPESAQKLYEKALSDLDNNKQKEAFESLKSALDIFPKYFVALERLGLEYIKLGHFEAAKILLSIAVDVNPRSYRSWYGLAHTYYSLNQLGKALEPAKKAVELNSFLPEAQMLLGVLERRSKNYNEAEKHLVKAKELAKDSIPEINWQLALLYANNLNRYQEAAKELKHFLKISPDSKDNERIKKLIDEFEQKAKNKG